MGHPVSQKMPVIRVVIAEARSAALEFKKSYTVYDYSKKSMLLKRAKNTFKVHVGTQGLIMDGSVTLPNRVFIDSEKAEVFELNGRMYRGDVALLRNGKNILVVNYVSIEDYLKSVVPSEISKLWRVEALKAQAVASRGFAYYHMMTNAERDYDVAFELQQYHGIEAENPKTSWAVDVTFGQILEYHSNTFPSFFHAVCGGYTENADAVWKNTTGFPEPVPCTFCRNSRYYSWEYSCSVKTLSRLIREEGYKCTELNTIRAGKMARFFSRVRSVVVTADGKDIDLPINIFRKIIGYGNVRSGIFSITKKGSSFYFKGQGWGHGVGLCQYGAKTMAENGLKYHDILYHYYPKTTLKRVY